MGLTDKIGIAILCAFVLFSVVRLFAAPLKLAAKVLLNTALGFLALFVENGIELVGHLRQQ